MKQAAASTLVKVGAHVTAPHVVDALLPCFQALGSDSVWTVRQAAAKACPRMAALMDPAARSHLLPLVRSWLQDRSHWVRDAMLSRLGKVLLLLPTHEVPDGTC